MAVDEAQGLKVQTSAGQISLSRADFSIPAEESVGTKDVLLALYNKSFL